MSDLTDREKSVVQSFPEGMPRYVEGVPDSALRELFERGRSDASFRSRYPSLFSAPITDKWEPDNAALYFLSSEGSAAPSRTVLEAAFRETDVTPGEVGDEVLRELRIDADSLDALESADIGYQSHQWWGISDLSRYPFIGDDEQILPGRIASIDGEEPSEPLDAWDPSENLVSDMDWAELDDDMKRHRLREETRDSLDAAGYGDEINVDARADGTIVLQDAESNETRRVDVGGDVNETADAIAGGDSEPENNDREQNSSPGGGADGLGQVGGIMLVAAIATAVYYGVTQL
jgi:hypothetical protein